MNATANPKWDVKHLVLAAGLLVALIFLWTCCRKVPPPPSVAVDCQQDSVLIVYRTDTIHGLDTVTASDMPLVGRIANLPEYHDCQRLLVRGDRGSGTADSLRYGPLVAIWAADSLAGRLPKDSTDLPTLAIPVAVVFNAERATAYAPLGIQPGFSCLYLRHLAAGPTGWGASLVPLPGGPAECAAPLDTLPRSAFTLRVWSSPPPRGLTADDIPQVTRWDWDPRTSTQYIDIRCGTELCAVGAPGFEPSPSLADAGSLAATLAAEAEPIPGIADGDAPTGKPNERARVFAIKSWYDEQRLDLRDPQGRPTLTDIVGTVVPHPALGRAPFPPGRWTPVGWAVVPASYDGKVPLESGVSRMYICPERSGECQVPVTAPCEVEAADAALLGAPPMTWWTRIVSEDGSVAYHCIKRRFHGGKTMPAPAARWNWYELDAKTWVACGGACCTAN
jgi:hypothetical protein